MREIRNSREGTYQTLIRVTVQTDAGERSVAGTLFGKEAPRLVEIFAKRLQTQETMTMQIADAIEDHLSAAGVAVLIDAEHQCMSTRGVHHHDVSTITTQFRGVFKTDKVLQQRFMDLVQRK